MWILNCTMHTCNEYEREGDTTKRPFSTVNYWRQIDRSVAGRVLHKPLAILVINRYLPRSAGLISKGSARFIWGPLDKISYDLS